MIKKISLITLLIFIYGIQAMEDPKATSSTSGSTSGSNPLLTYISAERVPSQKEFFVRIFIKRAYFPQEVLNVVKNILVTYRETKLEIKDAECARLFSQEVLHQLTTVIDPLFKKKLKEFNPETKDTFSELLDKIQDHYNYFYGTQTDGFFPLQAPLIKSYIPEKAKPITKKRSLPKSTLDTTPLKRNCSKLGIKRTQKLCILLKAVTNTLLETATTAEHTLNLDNLLNYFIDKDISDFDFSLFIWNMLTYYSNLSEKTSLNENSLEPIGNIISIVTLQYIFLDRNQHLLDDSESPEESLEKTINNLPNKIFKNKKNKKGFLNFIVKKTLQRNKTEFLKLKQLHQGA